MLAYVGCFCEVAWCSRVELGVERIDGLEGIHNYLQFLVVLGRAIVKTKCDASQ